MGFFDFLKKNKAPEYDSTNITVNDLNTGFIFEYDMRSWEVLASYEYDWGNNYFTHEFKITDGRDTKFLEVEPGDVMMLSLLKKINLREIDPGLAAQLSKTQLPPEELKYDGLVYYRESESPGYCKNIDKPDAEWDEFVVWDYTDQSGNFLLAIEQWDDNAFEASWGERIEEYQISNILPSQS